ncbi:MAG: TolC family protein [Desulfobacteraceae bacterium]|jgi:outer membrane protein TolC
MDSGSPDSHSVKELNTLDDYIKYALLNNPGLKAAYEKWLAALEKVAPAGTLPDPKMTFAYYINEVETRVGPQKYSVGINQTFPWFGKLDLKSKAASEMANVEKAKYDALKLMLISKIKKLYYQYSYLAQSIKITQDNITLVSNFEDVATAKYKGGAGLQNAVIKIQVELGKLDDRLTSLKDSITPVVAKLNSAMNRPSSASLPVPENIPDEKISMDKSELISLLRSGNPKLKALDYMAEKDNYMIDLAGKNYYPDFTLGLNYISTEPRYDATPADNGKDPVVASVSVNIPLWRKKYHSIKREAQAEQRSVRRSREEMENNLVADLEMAIFELRDADRKITLYRDTLLKKAEQNVSINQLAFASDKASFLDLIDAQRVLLEFQLAEKKALADYGKALADIEMLTACNSKGN